MVRLNKYLADCGIAARRKCDELILSGLVSVNGETVLRLGAKVDEQIDDVRVRDRSVKPAANLIYLLLNKPKGVITTSSDESGRKTVLDIVRVDRRIFSVGRLDRDTSGLLLLTNDGDLAYRLTHPKYEVDKRYRVRLSAALSEADRQRLQKGVRLDEGVTSRCSIEFPAPEDASVLIMTIHQGWKRQIRRMFEVCGYKVKSLHRTGVGPLNLRGVKRGEWRRLRNDELRALKRQVSQPVENVGSPWSSPPRPSCD